MEHLTTQFGVDIMGPCPAPELTTAASRDVEGPISSEALRRLLTHWIARRGNRALPARYDLAEDRLTRALKDLVLYELSCEGRDESEADVMPASAALVRGLGAPYREVLLRRQPVYCSFGCSGGSAVERLLLPLSRDGVRVDSILVGIERPH